jgi:transcriptional regulator with XRE-family HTH domain
MAAALTQEELAERAGISVRAISDLERGVKLTPRKDTVRLLAEALGLTAGEAAAFQAAASAARTLSLELPPREEQRAAETGTGAGRSEAEAAGARAVPSAIRHNLPAALSSFIGREQEQAAVRQLLGEARLVTLIGTGGVGKTRLALQGQPACSRRTRRGSGWWSWRRWPTQDWWRRQWRWRWACTRRPVGLCWPP